MNRRIKTALAVIGFVACAMSVARASETVTYYHTDALGSVVATSDANGNITERREYEPYGAQLTPAVSDGPGYTGHVSDAATGLSYMQQRYYDPLIGRFLSVDPVTANGGTGANFNRYWYANNNPYRFTDPDGRQSREFNFENQRAGIKPPPVSDKDWLNKPLGLALSAVVAAPLLANPAIATTAVEVGMGDALGGASLVGGGTALFRVVDNIEMNSIKQFGEFLPAPNGDSVKRFVDNLPDAKALAQKFSKVFGGEQRVVQGVAPQKVMDASTVTRFSDVPGQPMNSVNVPNEQLPNIKCTGLVDGC